MKRMGLVVMGCVMGVGLGFGIRAGAARASTETASHGEPDVVVVHAFEVGPRETPPAARPYAYDGEVIELDEPEPAAGEESHEHHRIRAVILARWAHEEIVHTWAATRALSDQPSAVEAARLEDSADARRGGRRL